MNCIHYWGPWGHFYFWEAIGVCSTGVDSSDTDGKSGTVSENIKRCRLKRKLESFTWFWIL